ncbi:MAG TPA: hypothetical protein VFH58_11640 [Acidimicrobiales bacterium]|nr:hypothetical protein [Acidimicrobiales bacterium]
MKPSDERALLRWYPAEWRQRYGAEMLAMVEDTLGGRPPTYRLRAELMLAGIRERLRRGGFTGRDRPATERCRAALALVLAGWAALVVAAGMFAKTTEHWSDRIPPAHRVASGAAYLTLEIAGAVGATAVVVGVVAALPTLGRALAAGGWRSMRRPVRLAAILTALALIATVGLGAWAHRLTSVQRNGGSGPYSAAFLAWGVVLVATIAAWTRAGIRVERELRPTVRLLRVEWIVAALTGVATVAVTAAMAAWWLAVALQSPWVLYGRSSGSAGSWWTPSVGAASLVALVGSAAAIAGGHRLASAARAGLWQRARRS